MICNAEIFQRRWRMLCDIDLQIMYKTYPNTLTVIELWFLLYWIWNHVFSKMNQTKTYKNEKSSWTTPAVWLNFPPFFARPWRCRWKPSPRCLSIVACFQKPSIERLGGAAYRPTKISGAPWILVRETERFIGFWLIMLQITRKKNDRRELKKTTYLHQQKLNWCPFPSVLMSQTCGDTAAMQLSNSAFNQSQPTFPKKTKAGTKKCNKNRSNKHV